MKKLTVIETQFTKIALLTEKSSSNNEDLIRGLVLYNEAHEMILNRIYAAKVINIVESLEGAFLDIGLSQNAFMGKKSLCLALGFKPSEKMKHPMNEWLKVNQLVLGQVSREPYQSKGAKLTHDISLEGKYFILLPNGRGVKYSKKLREKTLPSEINTLIEAFNLDGCGLIVRSQILKTVNALDIYNDLNQVFQKWQRIKSQFALLSNHKCLYHANDFYDEIYRKLFDETVTRISINQSHIKEILLEKGISNKITIEKQFDVLFTLKCLAKLRNMLLDNVFSAEEVSFTLDELEAFTIIDVNSARKVSQQDKSEMALTVNRKVAAYIKELFLLRQISGVILIDFINMTSQHAKAFLTELTDHIFTCEDDFTVHGYSALGLLELSRKRLGASVLDQLSFDVNKRDLHYLDLLMIHCELERTRLHTSVNTMSLTVPESLFIFLSQTPLQSDIKIKLVKEIAKPVGFKLHHMK